MSNNPNSPQNLFAAPPETTKPRNPAHTMPQRKRVSTNREKELAAADRLKAAKARASTLRKTATSKAAKAMEAAAAAAVAHMAYHEAAKAETQASEEAAAALVAAETSEREAEEAAIFLDETRYIAAMAAAAARNYKTWDVQVAIHCLKPTGKPTVTSKHDIVGIINEIRKAIETSSGAIARACDNLSLAKEKTMICAEAEKVAQQHLEEEEKKRSKLFVQWKKLASGAWKPSTPRT